MGQPHPASADIQSDGKAERRSAVPVTARAALLGAGAVALMAAVNPVLAYVTGTWTVGEGSLISSAVELLFLMVAANTGLARFASSFALTRGELLAAYGMMIIPAHLLHTGGIPYMIACTTYPFYMATPSNAWEHVMWPNIPLWLRLDSIQAVNWFWEGMPQEAGVPWGAWAWPIVGWSSFTVALGAAMYCLGGLLSKDWIERQRLTFPLVSVPLSLTGDAAQPTLGSSILRNRTFWIGFAVPALLALLGWLQLIYPSVPAPQLYSIEVGRYFAGMGLPWTIWSGHSGIRISIIFSVIGITCLLPSEVSLSLWLFYVIYRLQQLIWASFGVTEAGGASALAIDPQAFIGFEEAGGFVALSLMILYQSRKSLRTAALGLVSRARQTADPYQPLPGRWALLGFAVANAFMFWWASQAGMSWWAFGAWLGVFYTVLIGVSRLVAAGGVMHVDTGVFPRGVIMSTVGAYPLRWQSLTMYTYLSVVYTYDPRSVLMPQMMNSFKLAHTAKLKGRAFSWVALLSVLVALGVGFPMLLRLVYKEGATTLPTWPFTSYPAWGFGELQATLTAPELPSNWLRLALVLGGVFTAALVWLHTRFVWWPVSPVGFLIASSYETNRSIWVNALIAWLVTSVIRRYGGLRLYRRFYPAFLGLVLGDFLPRSLLAILSTVFGVKQTSV